MTFRVGVRPYTARSAPMLFCSVNSVAPLFLCVKTLAYFQCFERRTVHVVGTTRGSANLSATSIRATFRAATDTRLKAEHDAVLAVPDT